MPMSARPCPACHFADEKPDIVPPLEHSCVVLFDGFEQAPADAAPAPLLGHQKGGSRGHCSPRYGDVRVDPTGFPPLKL